MTATAQRNPPEVVKAPAGHLLREGGSRFAVVGAWVLLIILYGVLEPSKFLTTSTFQTIFSSQQVLVFLTAALLCTVCVGEFVDLSVASNLVLAAIVVPVLVVNHHWKAWAASVVATVAVAFGPTIVTAPTKSLAR